VRADNRQVVNGIRSSAIETYIKIGFYSPVGIILSQCIQGVPPKGVNAVPSASPLHSDPPPEGVNAAPSPPHAEPDAIVPDEDGVGYPRTLASLIATEFAGVTIYSDTHRNPLTSDNNMKIPPAIFDQAMQCSDRDHWLAAMRKEINLMSEMNVYELVKLPEGQRAIGCRCQPPGFEQPSHDGASLVCHLLSSLYGLKQAVYD
jgi:hypothetical protein